MGEGSRMVVSGRGWGRGQTPGWRWGALWRPLGSIGSWSEGEPLEEMLTQPSLGASQPVEVSQVLPILLMSVTSSSRTWLSRNHRDEGLWAEPRACRSKGPGSGSFPWLWLFHGVLSFIPFILGMQSLVFNMCILNIYFQWIRRQILKIIKKYIFQGINTYVCITGK